MYASELVAKIKGRYRDFDNKGYISAQSIYEDIETALKKFGGTICVPEEKIITAKNGVAPTPHNFFDLIYAYKCDPYMCEVPDMKVIPHLQHEIAFKERAERGFRFCSCDECCKDEYENTVVEKFYINGFDVKYHYNNVTLPKLGDRMKKDLCLRECRNLFVKESPHEIVINGNKTYVNFDGNIYMKYRGTPVDENGIPFIPDTSLGHLANYVETYVKLQLMMEVIANADEPRAASLLNVFRADEQIHFNSALRECKMQGITPETMQRMAISNRRRMEVYERGFWPNLPKHIKLI